VRWDRARGQAGGDVPQDAIQALDVALKHGTALKANCQAFARAFFWDDPTKVRPLGGGAEVGLPLEPTPWQRPPAQRSAVWVSADVLLGRP
jgi:hypothetical protein